MPQMDDWSPLRSTQIARRSTRTASPLVNVQVVFRISRVLHGGAIADAHSRDSCCRCSSCSMVSADSSSPGLAAGTPWYVHSIGYMDVQPNPDSTCSYVGRRPPSAGVQVHECSSSTTGSQGCSIHLHQQQQQQQWQRWYISQARWHPPPDSRAAAAVPGGRRLIHVLGHLGGHL